MDFRTPDPAVVNLSKKEALLHRISQHIEQAQVSSPAYSLSNLAQKGSEELIDEFLGDDLTTDTSTLESLLQSQLYVSSFWGFYDIVRILIENRANVNHKNASTLWTPLHAATFHDHGKVVMLLLENGADPLSEDFKGRTPADFASTSEKIWSHFDVLAIKRASKAQLIRKKILPGTEENLDLQSLSITDDRTKSGIKLETLPSLNTAANSTGNSVRLNTSRRNNSATNSSQMKQILNGDSDMSPLSSGRKRQSLSQNRSSAVSSLLSWD